jgi:oligogalacturonide lyase
MMVADADISSEAAPVTPSRITAPQGAGDQLLYFTSHSLMADDRTVVFIREIDGNPNLWACDLSTGTTRRLTHNTDGYLKSYVYFDGRTNQGFGKASVSLDSTTGRAYFIQGLELRCVEPNGTTRTLATLRDDEVTAFTHVSSRGRFICVPTTDARALDGKFVNNRPTYDIDRRVREEGLRSYLNLFDTTTGRLLHREVIEGAWVTHVQFSPRNPSLVLYNHEWPSECGVRRVWLWDGKTHSAIRTEGDGRSRGDWVCHEMWSRDGKSIIYHGRYAGTDPVTDGGRLVFGAGNGAAFIGRRHAYGADTIEIALPEHCTRYGHFTAGNGDWLVTDGYYETPDDPPGHGAWLSLLKPDWDRRTIEWRPLCRHGSSWKSQDEHPHPMFDHAGQEIFFTSDVGGTRAIYRVPCGPEQLN